MAKSSFFSISSPWKDAITDRDEQTDSRIEKTEPLNSSGSSSDSEDELGTSASVQEEKREFEAGLSDLRHKLAQEVILEEEEGKCTGKILFKFNSISIFNNDCSVWIFSITGRYQLCLSAWSFCVELETAFFTRITKLSPND